MNASAEDFAKQREWFGHLDTTTLAIRALRDCREKLRTSDAAERSPEATRLVVDLARYAESRLAAETGAEQP